MSTETTYDLSLLELSATKWREQGGLRQIYGAIARQLTAWAPPGPALEVGGGIGWLREYIPGLVVSDVAPTPYAEVVADAYQLSALGRRWQAIYAMDVLHHLTRPIDFFASAAAVLEPGGRILLSEPAGSAWGRWFYGRFHPEPCCPRELAPPFRYTTQQDGLFANMGMSVALLRDHRPWFDQALAELDLQVVAVRWRDVLAYPLTGGFSKPQFLPTWAIRGLEAAEGVVPQALMRKLALRVVFAIEKRS